MRGAARWAWRGQMGSSGLSRVPRSHGRARVDGEERDAFVSVCARERERERERERGGEREGGEGGREEDEEEVEKKEIVNEGSEKKVRESGNGGN